MSKLNHIKAATWVLRIGLAFIFLYAGSSSLMHPLEWVGFLPNYLITPLPFSATTIIKSLGLYEVILSLWLLSSLWTPYSALLAALTLLGIITATFSQLITTFRDVGLLCMAIALFLITLVGQAKETTAKTSKDSQATVK